MSAGALDPYLSQTQSDELPPPPSEEDPITWLDEAGLHAELDAAVDAVRGALGETRARSGADVRRAVAGWMLASVKHQLVNAHLLATGGPEHFFSVLAPTPARRDDDQDGGEDQVF